MTDLQPQSEIQAAPLPLKEQIAYVSDRIDIMNVVLRNPQDPSEADRLKAKYGQLIDERTRLKIKDIQERLPLLKTNWNMGALIDSYTQVDKSTLYATALLEDIYLLAKANGIAQSGRVEDGDDVNKIHASMDRVQGLHYNLMAQHQPYEPHPSDRRDIIIRKAKRFDHVLNMMNRYEKMIAVGQHKPQILSKLIKAIIPSLDFFSSSSEQIFLDQLEEQFNEQTERFFNSLPDSPYFRREKAEAQQDTEDIDTRLNNVEVIGLENGSGSSLGVTNEKLREEIKNHFIPSRFLYGIRRINFWPYSEAPKVDNIKSYDAYAHGNWDAKRDKNGNILESEINIFVIDGEFWDSILPTIIHEIGHNAHALLSLEEIEEWRKVVRNERGVKHMVTSYVHENKLHGSADQFNIEDWAETFEDLGPSLYRKSPKRFNYMT